MIDNRRNLIYNLFPLILCLAVISCSLEKFERELIIATEEGDRFKVKVLLDKGADINATDYHGYELEREIDRDPENLYDATALSVAAFNGHFKITKLLLERGADIDAVNRFNSSALSVATLKGYPNIAKLLVDAGADIELQNYEGETSLIIAAERGFFEIAGILLEKGADTDIENYRGETALLLASYEGYPEIVKILLEKGADTEVENYGGKTSLILASEKGHRQSVELLLEHGADIEAKDENNNTALIWATDTNHYGVVELLLAKGADTEVKDDKDVTTLIYEAEKGHTGIVKLLLEKGANTEEKNREGETTLIVATENGHTGIVTLLLEYGANTEAKNSDAETVLIIASREGQYDIVRVLLEKGADTEEINSRGETALILAAKTNSTKIVRLLLENGANVNALSDSVEIALDFAKKYEVRKLLIGYMEKSDQLSKKRVEATKRKVSANLLITELEFQDKHSLLLRDKVLNAGEKAGIVFILKNTGKGIGYDVILSVKGNDPKIKTPGFKKKLGDIQPGERRKITIPIKAGKNLDDGMVDYLIQAREDRGFHSRMVKLSIMTSSLVPPKLDITLVELNDGNYGQAKGNGNGIPEKNETVVLIVHIHNSGKGEALGVNLALTDITPGLEVRRSKTHLGIVHPGETVIGNLVFSVPRRQGIDRLKYSLKATDVRGVGQASWKFAKNYADTGPRRLNAVKQEIEAVSDRYSDKKELGRIFAIIIGIADYQNDLINDLNYPENDAVSFNDFLMSKEGGGVPRERIRLLVGSEATADNIRSAVGDWLPAAANKKSDRVVLFFAGHGIKRGRRGYLLAYNSDPKKLVGTSVKIRNISEYLEEVEAGTVIFLSDACHIGAAFKKKLAARLERMDGGFLINRFSGEGRIIMVAAKSDQESLELPEYKHGLFTYFLLKGLKGEADKKGNQDKKVDINELYQYVYRQVYEDAKKHDYSQNPKMNSQVDGDIIMALVP